MQRDSPRLRSMQLFLFKICGEIFYPILQIYATLVPIRMGIKLAAGSQQKHLSLSFAADAYIVLSRNSKALK